MSTSSIPIHPRVLAVTERIADRSRAERASYLGRMTTEAAEGPTRARLSCTNLAHGFAAASSGDKDALKDLRWPNLGIVSAYNDMLSAHQPFEATRASFVWQHATPARPHRLPAAYRQCVME